MSVAYKISRFNRERKWKIFNKLDLLQINHIWYNINGASH